MSETPAAWIADRLHPFCQDVGSVVPEGFDAYVRILHPIELDGRVERWADVAARNGRVVHPEMQLHMISRPVGTPSPDRYDPGPGYRSGSLRREERAALLSHLRPATATPDACWFAMWEGWSDREHQGVPERLELPKRSYLLAGGPIDDVLAPVQSPSLWWPDDRAWFVATEVDYAWTYVGGTSEVIDAILVDVRLEAVRARLSDKPFYDSDILNAALDG